MRISHETIYRSVYITRWKVVPRELCKRLRTGRPIRKNKRHTVKGQWRSQIRDARPIEERPQAAEDRSESGHLEGDLVIGSNNSQVATLVDRKTRFLQVVKLASRHTTVVVPALAETYTRMDSRLRGTLTWDRGMELAAHKRLSADTGIDVFFAAPRSPLATWHQREHQQVAPPVPAQGDEPVDLQPGRPQRHRDEAQQPSAQVPRFPDTSRERCPDRLNLRFATLIDSTTAASPGSTG